MENHKKQGNGKFKSSSNIIKTSFILGIVGIVGLVVLILTVDSIVYYTLFGTSKIPLYIIFSLYLASTLILMILGGISFRKGKNIYGIIGFILQFVAFAISIGFTFATTQLP
ncbi:MAG TPA: hypothetical protein VMZ29_14945 [Candidatus Bathyarchaeia archaeon]|nr:hypothetical protein [Candidatus Bathyarchaeia archaeon]